MVCRYSFLLFVGVYQTMLLLGSSTPVPEEPINRPLGPCEMMKKSAVLHANTFGDQRDQPIPDCDEYGYYKLVQCNLDGCHCSNPYGNLIGEVFDPPKYYLSNKDCEKYLIRS